MPRRRRLTLNDYVMYTTTSSGCGGVPNAVWALDLRVEDPKPVSFPLNGGAAGGLGGYALGNDGTVYVQTGPGPSDPASNKYSNTLLAFEPRDLKLRGHFSVASESKAPAEMNVTTPVVFEYKGRDLVVSAGRDGRLYVLDSQSVGGADHKTPLSQTDAARHRKWRSLGRPLQLGKMPTERDGSRLRSGGPSIRT